jgi:LacI family transcriptional regulator
MSPREARRRATLKDVALEAGVSVATADRAVNGRAGVREKTLTRVSAAVARLGYRPHPAAARLARSQTFRFAFVLPSNTNAFMASLEAHLAKASGWLAGQNAFVDVIHADVFDVNALADVLESLPAHYQGVAVVALDHPRVRVAIDALVRRAVKVVTLVSDTPRSARAHYVGINNLAAGRTAGSLLGRFVRSRRGKIGVIAGSLSLLDHAERYFGFNQVIADEHPGLEILPVSEGRDDNGLNRSITGRLLREHADIVGFYNVGAGNDGVAEALEASGRAGDITWIAHELSAESRRWLASGVADAIIAQDAGHEARSAARVLLAHCAGEAIIPEQEMIRIEVFLRDNLP